MSRGFEGKPVESQGRKATGLKRASAMVAGSPMWVQTFGFDCACRTALISVALVLFGALLP